MIYSTNYTKRTTVKETYSPEQARTAVHNLCKAGKVGIAYKTQTEHEERKHVLLEVSDEYFIVSESWTDYQLAMVWFRNLDLSMLPEEHVFILHAKDAAKKLLKEYPSAARARKKKDELFV